MGLQQSCSAVGLLQRRSAAKLLLAFKHLHRLIIVGGSHELMAWGRP